MQRKMNERMLPDSQKTNLLFTFLFQWDDQWSILLLCLSNSPLFALSFQHSKKKKKKKKKKKN